MRNILWGLLGSVVDTQTPGLLSFPTMRDWDGLLYQAKNQSCWVGLSSKFGSPWQICPPLFFSKKDAWALGTDAEVVWLAEKSSSDSGVGHHILFLLGTQPALIDTYFHHIPWALPKEAIQQLLFFSQHKYICYRRTIFSLILIPRPVLRIWLTALPCCTEYVQGFKEGIWSNRQTGLGWIGLAYILS